MSDSRDTLLRELMLEKYEPIAIVGVGLRFPGGATTPEEFEEFLRSGRSGTGPIPGDRWDVESLHREGPAEKGRISAAGGGFLEGIDQFDAAFFNISPKEAAYVDPQHRLALEASWDALENAGIDPGTLRGSEGGVYFGISCFDYLLEVGELAQEDLDAYTGTGTAHSAVPGRLSYLLGWRGPSMAIDTACSSSIVALDLAVTGLRKRDCSIALCGGVNAIHHPLNHIVFSQAGMLSPDGRCKTFDDTADGYARSEGCGVVVLKRFSDAKRDGDRILALIRGTAVRQDGESGGLTVPNSTGQQGVMRAALRNASLEPSDIQYVEAHGTGTSLGDPIEMQSVSSVFAESHTVAEPVVVGSLKTNVGHMEAAAGIGGVIKTALQLHHGWIYPHLNLEQPSQHIPWDRSPVTVPTEGQPWKAPVRRALVNSFGFAGTIASAVLEQAPAQAAPAVAAPAAGGNEVFVLSARSERALRRQADKYLSFLEAEPGAGLGDIAYTAAVGRAHFAHRLGGLVGGRDELAALLREQSGTAVGEQPRVAMLFTGQGAQYPGMGRSLYERYPVFQEHMDECDRLFEPHLGRSVRDLMLGDDPADELGQTQYTQPALFAVEYATARLWMSFGVEPAMLIGHSIGEVVAAAVAGLFSLEDAVRLVAARSRLMQSVSAPGGMVSVQAAMDTVAPFVQGCPDVAFAAVNTPQSCVVSGGSDSLAEIVAKLGARGIATQALKVSHAFHSPLMAEVFDEFAAAIADVQFHEPDLTLVSNVTGAVAVFEEIATPEYWVRHIGAPVEFAAGMRTIAEHGEYVFLEVGPSATLLGLGRRCVAGAGHTWLASAHRDDPAADTLKRSVAELYRAGLDVSWAAYHLGREAGRLTLPTYAYDRRRHWLPRRRGLTPGSGAGATHPLLGAEVRDHPDQREGVRVFMSEISPDCPGYLRDHVVLGQIVVPAACYVDLLLALQDAMFGETGRPLADIDIQEPLIVSDDHGVELLTRVRAADDGGATVEVSSRIAGDADARERLHATARIGADAGQPGTQRTADALTEAAAAATAPGEAVPADDLYGDFEDLGLAYGPEFQRITSLRREGEGVAVALLRGHDTALAEYLPPFVLDNVIQSVAGVLDDGETYLPVGFGLVQFLRKPKSATLRSLLRLTGADDGRRERTADMMLLDGDRPVAVVRGLRFRQVVAVGDGNRRRLFHETRWVKRSTVRRAAEQERDILVVNRPARQFTALAGRLEDTGARLRYAADARAAGALLAQERPTDVWWFWTAGTDRDTAAGLRDECERNYRDLLALIEALTAGGFGQGQRLWLVTEGAQLLPGDAQQPGQASAAATLWGFGRSLGNEYPAYRVTMVDLPGEGDTDCSLLFDECLAAEGEEFQIAFRRGKRHVLRIFPTGDADDQDENFELAVPNPGEFSGIKRIPVPDEAPQGDEVEVRVRAAGLNFKDVLNALGMLKQHADAMGVEYRPLPLGFEAAGTVAAAGPDAAFAVGDDVVVSHLGCLRKRVVVPSAAVVRKPPALGFAEAAALPTAYTTAYYSLHELAGMKAGDRVLIHAAAGGVGQAAVALARLAGAEIHATASPGKHAFLRAQGIEHVMNSRSLDFADEIRRSTGGAGVDIVLNSLNSDYIPAGLSVLAEGGRFVELGKLGIWSPERMREARPDVAYHNFDLSEFDAEELQQINKRILETVADLLADGSLAPITTTTYTLDEVEEAFGVLSRGGNTGKLVIDMREPAVLGSRPEPALDPGKSYLITGGTGALGAVTAQKLAAEGARHISMVSRRPVSAEDAAALQERIGKEVRLRFHRGDIAVQEDVERIMAETGAGGHPLGGIVHAAGVLADGPVSAMSWEQLDTVFRSKVYGTWLLHRAAEAQDGLDFFVGYSSLSSVLGPVGQANYAAGNAFIDDLMTRRSAAGAPGLAIGWGPWAEVGMAANLSARSATGIESQGFRFLKPRTGARALWTVLGQPLGHLTAGEVDWDRFVSQRLSGNALYQRVARGAAVSVRTIDLGELAALPRTQRRETINEAVRERIASLLHFDGTGDISPHARFMDLGVDSLTAVELKNALEVMFRASLPTSLVFDYPTVMQLAAFVDEQMAGAGQPPEAHGGDVAEVTSLPDEDIDAELESLRSM
ncbi:type I polyketide synthase [Streptomyces sp. JH14]|uniref:type I polyketide synthase n=1 Tax=Streptomyces sp. JH14 TaxID=2793630 RepID=UPI0023F8A09E|nr:type I polyketide synthase [Streptomyces sp. JH14]MDF6043848.1 type I polyketide synthase [Streptomyces sp. JH14]